MTARVVILNGYARRVLALATCLMAGLSVPGNPQATTPVTRRLYQVSVGERSGYIDSTGKTVIPLCFNEAWQFTEGLAVVQVRGRYGYIDTLGTIVIEPQFEFAQPFSEGLAIVGTRAKRYVIDRTGQVVIGPKFDVGSPSRFSDGRASATIDGIGGYIDHAGTMVIRSESRSHHPDFSDGLAAIEIGGKWGFIDTTGTMVIPPRFPRENYPFGPGTGFSHGFAAVPLGDKWGFIDKSGRVVIPARFDAADGFADGLARVLVGTRWGYIDTTGAFVVPPQFANTWGFSDGLAAVKVGAKWGYIDRTGRLIIAAQFEPLNRFDYMEGFWDGIARVRRGDDDGYIDRTGRFVWTSRRPGTASGNCPGAPSPQLGGAPSARRDTAALPALTPLVPTQPGSAPQADSARPILYYEEVNGHPVLTGLFLDGRRIVVPAENATTIPMWSPDGAWMAYTTGDSATHSGVLAVVNLKGERHRLFVARDSLPMHPRWSPDGRFIAAILLGTNDESSEPETVPLIVISVADAAVHHRVAIPVTALSARANAPKLRLSPDGQRVLVAGDIAVVATIGTGVIDTIARQPVTAEWGATGDVVYFFATADSARAGNGMTLGEFYVRRLADRQATLLANADRVARVGVPYPFVPPSRRVLLSPDGKRLALWGRASGDSSDVVRLYNITADSAIDLERPSATFPRAGRIMGLQWGPQGHGLAALVSTEIRYLDVVSGKWNTLAAVREGGAADYYGFGILSLSWTQ